MNNAELDNIDEYLRGTLSAKEKKQFERRLQDDPQLHEKYVERKQLQDGISFSALADLLEETDLWEKEIESPPHDANTMPSHLIPQDNSSQKKTSFFRRPLFILSIAASIIIAIFFLPQFQDQHSHDLDLANFVHLSSPISATRSVKNLNISLERERAYNLYNIKSYKLAAPRLIKVFETESDTTALLFAGISNIALGNYKKAKKQIETYQSLKPYDERTKPYLDILATKLN